MQRGMSFLVVSKSIQSVFTNCHPQQFMSLIGISKAQCIKNLGNVLEEAGSSWEKVVKVNVYLKNMDDFAAMNEVYSEASSFLSWSTVSTSPAKVVSTSAAPHAQTSAYVHSGRQATNGP
jgi:hypothetical protein